MDTAGIRELVAQRITEVEDAVQSIQTARRSLLSKSHEVCAKGFRPYLIWSFGPVYVIMMCAKARYCHKRTLLSRFGCNLWDGNS